jgi:hypothetical protein
LSGINAIEETKPGFGKLEMPKLNDLKLNRCPPNSSAVALAGVIRVNHDDLMLGSNEQNWLKRFQNDNTDFVEFKINLNEEELEYGDESKLQT